MSRSTAPKTTRRSPRGGRTAGRSRTRTSRTPSGDGASGWTRHGTALPEWSDLESGNRYRSGPTDGSFLQRVSTVRFALVVVVLAGAFTLYVGHVHATQDLLSRVQEARTENQRLHLKHNRLQGAYDRKTRPDVIYERARDLGLEASTTYGPPISMDE